MKEEEGKQTKKSHIHLCQVYCSCQRSSISNLAIALSQCTCVIINDGAAGQNEDGQKDNSPREAVVQNNCVLFLHGLQSSHHVLFNFIHLFIYSMVQSQNAQMLLF